MNPGRYSARPIVNRDVFPAIQPIAWLRVIPRPDDDQDEGWSGTNPKEDRLRFRDTNPTRAETPHSHQETTGKSWSHPRKGSGHESEKLAPPHKQRHSVETH